MQYYSPTTPTNIYEDLDERLDSTVPYLPHPEQYLDSKYQNINVIKQVSPPLTGPIKEIHTGCFKEDIEEPNYFQVLESPVLFPRRRNIEEEEDLSITSVNDLSPLELIQFQQEKETHKPLNLESYHSDLVHHYKQILLYITQHAIPSSLPLTYKSFIDHLKRNCIIDLPPSL